MTSTTSVKGDTGIIPGGEVTQEISFEVSSEYGQGTERETIEESNWSYTFQTEKTCDPKKGYQIDCSWDEQTFVERWLMWGEIGWDKIIIEIPNMFLMDRWVRSRIGKMTMKWHGYNSHGHWSHGSQIAFDGVKGIVDVCRGIKPELNPHKREKLADYFDEPKRRSVCIGSLVVRDQGVDFNQRSKDI